MATFADRDGAEDWGIGGVIHVNHTYSFGATTHGGDTGFFVSANLATLFEDVRTKANKYLRMVGL